MTFFLLKVLLGLAGPEGPTRIHNATTRSAEEKTTWSFGLWLFHQATSLSSSNASTALRRKSCHLPPRRVTKVLNAEFATIHIFVWRHGISSATPSSQTRRRNRTAAAEATPGGPTTRGTQEHTCPTHTRIVLHSSARWQAAAGVSGWLAD